MKTVSSKRRTILRLGILAAAVVAVAASLILLPGSDEPKVHPDQTLVPIQVATAVGGSPWSPNAIGLSLEATELTNPQLASGTFKDYLRALGAGTLRFAANAADETFWTSRDEPQPDWAAGKITPESLNRVAELSRASGWKISIGVNLQQKDPARAADEVSHATRILGEQLESIQIGNEPDVYYKEFNAYTAEYRKYVEAIRAINPKVNLVGGDLQGVGDFVPEFAKYQATNKDVSAMTSHFYPQTNCPDNKKPNVKELLAPDSRSYQENTVNRLIEQSKIAGLPLQINETNSVSCEGAQGVSDVYASAIWALDYGLMAQRAGVTRIEFHGSLGQCKAKAPIYKFYTPLCAATASDASSGVLTAQPEFMGLYAMRQIPAGQFAAVQNDGWQHVRAFAIKRQGSTTVVIVNIDDPKKFGSVPVSVKLDAGIKSVRSATLRTTSDKGLSARDGITFGDQQFDTAAKIETPVDVDVPIADNNTINFTTAPGTVTIVTMK